MHYIAVPLELKVRLLDSVLEGWRSPAEISVPCVDLAMVVSGIGDVSQPESL